MKYCHGKWYYEATHYPGGSNYHLIGFLMNLGGIYFYPRTNPATPCYFMDKNFSHNNAETEDIPFSANDEHTVGVGIDVDDHKFYVFYNNNFAYYDFVKPGIMRNLTPCIWGAVTPLTDDYVSVNFGNKPFKYSISGFTQWSKMPSLITCKQTRIHSLGCIIIPILIIVKF